MHTNTTHLIFWGNFSASYETTIEQYFQDVAHDSGGTANEYSVDPQYADTTGAAQYASTYGGVYADTSSPPNDCSTEYARTGITPASCVLDVDLQSEITKAMNANAANGWSAGLTNMYFVFTPQNVGSCFYSPGTTRDCAFTDYCAYHDYFMQGGQPVIYANQPYTDTSGVGAPGVCDSGSQPNGNWGDETINVASHEHNEAITDPELNAWWNSSTGEEIADQCAWMFGTALGSTNVANSSGEGSAYNEIIDGHYYYVQQEWNNATTGCVQRIPAPAPSVSGFTPGSGLPGTSVTISGSHFTGATSVKFNGTSATFSTSGDTSISASVPAGAKTGTISVTTANGTGTSSSSFTVLAPMPAITSFTPSSGPPGTVVKLTGSGFTGATLVKINGTSASFSVTSDSAISATVPGGASGTGPITVTTSGGTATSSTSFTVTAAPDFSILVSPASRSIARGATTTYTVTISRLNGFTGTVSLSVSGLPGSGPQGSTGTFSPPNLSSSQTTSTLTVTTRNNSSKGTSTLTITGTSGTLKHSQTATLTLT